MKNIIMSKPGESSFIRWIKKRIDNHLNFLAVVTGGPGVGKSYSCLEIAYEIDSDFNPLKQVFFDFRGLMKSINEFNDPETELGKKKYKVIVLEECQTIVNNKKWQSKTNQLFLYLLSTFRNQQFILLLNAPYTDFLDSASMKLIHAEISCEGWNKETKKSHTRPNLLQWNPKVQKYYRHKLFVITPGQKGYQKLVNWYISKPPKHITDPYETYKTAFTQALNLKITKELQLMANEDEPEEKGELNPESMQPELWDEVKKGYTSQEELRKRMEKRLDRRIFISQLNSNLIWISKKGYNYKNYKINS